MTGRERCLKGRWVIAHPAPFRGAPPFLVLVVNTFAVSWSARFSCDRSGIKVRDGSSAALIKSRGREVPSTTRLVPVPSSQLRTRISAFVRH